MPVQDVRVIALLRMSAKVAIICAVAFAALGAWSAGTSHAATLPCVKKEFSYAPDGYQPCVKDIQSLLNRVRGYYPYDWSTVLATDGYFGSITESVVKDFQKDQSISVDGIVGPMTWNNLCYVSWGVYNDNPPKTGAWANAGCAAEI